jgi:hypothetical protein
MPGNPEGGGLAVVTPTPLIGDRPVEIVPHRREALVAFDIPQRSQRCGHRHLIGPVVGGFQPRLRRYAT